MLFSIIIPFYNAEKYLERCVESILRQTYEDYEIVFIDDCSTDESVSIAQRYCSGNGNIHLLKGEHKGPAAARNVGIRNAKGEYILFIDADDTIEIDTLKEIYTVLNNKCVDICYMSSHYVIKGAIKKKNTVFNSIEGHTIYTCSEFARLIAQRGNRFPGSMWLMICQSKFLIQNELYLDESILWSEDTDYSYKVFSSARSIAVCDYVGYDWYKDIPQSLSKQTNIDKIFNRLDVYKKWYLFFLNDGIMLKYSKKEKKSFLQQILYNYCTYLFQVGIFEDQAINRELYRRLKEEEWLWKQCINWKIKIYGILGLGIGRYFNYLYYHTVKFLGMKKRI